MGGRCTTSGPELSVVIPYYNSGDCLENAVASVMKSDIKVECIIVNDGSTLASSEKALQVVKKNFPSIIIFSQKNNGLSAARNAGAALASAEFLFFLDADDWVSAVCLKELLSEARRSKAKRRVYVPAVLLKGSRSGWWIPNFSNMSQLYRNVLPYSVLIKKVDFVKVGGYRIELRRGLEDWDFQIRLMTAGFSLTRVPGAVLNYWVSDKGMLRSKTLPLYPEIYAEIMGNVPFNFLRAGAIADLKKGGVFSIGPAAIAFVFWLWPKGFARLKLGLARVVK